MSRSWCGESLARRVATRIPNFRWMVLSTTAAVTKSWAENGMSGSTSVVRLMAHRFADELVFRYTGEPGIARTKIVYVAEHGNARELFVMDYDGYEPKQITADGFLNLIR